MHRCLRVRQVGVVVFGPEREFVSPGGDYWVEYHAALVQFFRESRWVVAWR